MSSDAKDSQINAPLLKDGKEDQIDTKQKDKQFSPMAGIAYALVQATFVTSNRLFAKIVYEAHPALTTMQFLFYRSILAFAFIALI